MFTRRLILFYGLVYSRTIFALNSGDVCIIEETSRQGTCKSLKKCPTIIYGVANQKEPTMCGFEGEQRIVCCPDPIQGATTKRCSSENSSSQLQSDLLILKNQAKLKEFAHTAIIGFESDGHIRWRCAGTLISDEYVLTAAHCLVSDKRTRKYIRLGELNIESNLDNAKPETFNVTEIIPYPDYTPSLIYNDIALVRMDRKVKISPYIRPACLAVTSVDPNTEATVSSWGATECGYLSSHMLKFRVSILTLKECDNRYNGTGIIPIGISERTHICGEPTTIDRDLCKGSSGAPLTIYDHSPYPCQQAVIGFSSFGAGCGAPIRIDDDAMALQPIFKLGLPTVYTKVFSYIDWIKTIVKDI